MSSVLKPWREVAVPHHDVLEGTFLQSEFAADLTAVRQGRAEIEYQDATKFFERTYITEGMRILLTQVAERLSGRGGEPVIQLQTSFGGGKTHTMLAVYHLATRKGALSTLSGVASIMDRVGLLDVPTAHVAVIDGTAHAPSQPWKHGPQVVHTLWGELAWQLGGAEGYAMVAESDRRGTSPGKEVLRELLSAYSPCVVLIDELVAYVRQFADGQTYSGGTYASQISFLQALTEAVKLVPQAVLLGSLPESELEAGGQVGVEALRAIEKTFGRVNALWKPVDTDEAFEIVRRRLFEPIRDETARDVACRRFADLYVEEGSRVPGETQESRYYQRLAQAYPVHPEVFDRLYEDWTTIEGFQRTRGVLKLLAKIIHRLWKSGNKDLLILPGSLPLADGQTRNEFTAYLPAGWDPVIERDVDGDRAETTELESSEPRFGQVEAARRVARTLFLGTAPSSVAGQSGTRGLDAARVLLGCLQPGQSAATFTDALNRLADRLHYLNVTGERGKDSARYWLDTRANLRREMEDRKRRFDQATDVLSIEREALRQALKNSAVFDGAHVFVGHADVPDDSGLRLVVLDPERWYAKAEARLANESILETLRLNGSRPRYRANRLLFLAADSGVTSRMHDAARTVLAWRTIVADIRDGKLNVDQYQKKSADQALETAEKVLPRVARECYRWLIAPIQGADGPASTDLESFALSTSGNALMAEIERVCAENELVVSEWSPIHLRTGLKSLYWKSDSPAVSATTYWEDSQRYVYLPRLRNREVFAKAVRAGAASRDFFGLAYGQTNGRYEGFALGSSTVTVDDTLLLIDPDAARAYELAEAERATINKPPAPEPGGEDKGYPEVPKGGKGVGEGPRATPKPGPKAYKASADIKAASAKFQMVQIADEIIQFLASDPNATVKVTVEIDAEFLRGAPEHIRRAITENSKALGLRVHEWE